GQRGDQRRDRRRVLQQPEVGGGVASGIGIEAGQAGDQLRGAGGRRARLDHRGRRDGRRLNRRRDFSGLLHFDRGNRRRNRRDFDRGFGDDFRSGFRRRLLRGLRNGAELLLRLTG